MELDLDRDMRSLAVPGLSAAVVAHGAVVCAPVAGTADTDRGIRVTPDTVFSWASVSKTVTATALMQLFDRGLFELDDDISDYLSFPVRIPRCLDLPVTFRQLLTHTSGIKDSKVYDSLYVDGDSPIPLGEFIEDYLAVGGRYYNRRKNFRRHCPGSVSEYSNIAVGAIGRLVEVLSGLPFARYVTDHIFDPLGMTNTSFTLDGLDRAQIALPDGNGPLQGFPTFPDGTMRSSPSNLAKFLIAYMRGGRYDGGEILTRATVEEMLRPQTPLDPAQGLIWYSERFGKEILWGHNGDDPGISANMFFHPESEFGVLLVANGEWRHDARRTMRKLLGYAREH
jgi:CubicO group peptidase (beta-lactamase class C family)